MQPHRCPKPKGETDLQRECHSTCAVVLQLAKADTELAGYPKRERRMPKRTVVSTKATGNKLGQLSMKLSQTTQEASNKLTTHPNPNPLRDESVCVGRHFVLPGRRRMGTVFSSRRRRPSRTLKQEKNLQARNPMLTNCVISLCPAKGGQTCGKLNQNANRVKTVASIPSGDWPRLHHSPSFDRGNQKGVA